MTAGDLALVRGFADTKRTLVRWNLDPWPVVGAWTGGATLITAGLLLAVLVVSLLSTPDATRVILPGLGSPADGDAVAEVVRRNGLVLALHAMACVAGFIAGSSLPHEAERYSGTWRRVHDLAGPLAIAFVTAATLFSLVTQAYALGGNAATLAAQEGLARPVLLWAILPHALPELVALFLPLAAWLRASRAGDWHELLAATVVTVAAAVPILVAAAVVEVHVTPHVVVALGG